MVPISELTDFDERPEPQIADFADPVNDEEEMVDVGGLSFGNFKILQTPFDDPGFQLDCLKKKRKIVNCGGRKSVFSRQWFQFFAYNS